MIAVVALTTLISNNAFAFTVYQPFPALSISFFIDRLAAFFLLIIAIVSGCVAAFFTEYIELLDGGARRNVLCGCTNIFILAMVLVVASANTLSFIFFWELMAASSFFLVMYEGPTRRRHGRQEYFISS